MRSDRTSNNKTIKKFKFWNKYLVIPLYRLNILPIFFIGRIFLLLQTVGRKTGKKRYTPLEYRKKDGNILIFSSRGKYSNWYRNIIANPEKVRYKLGFRWYSPKVTDIDSFDERMKIMKWYVNSFHSASKTLFGWDEKIDTLKTADLNELVEFIRIIRFSES